MEVNKEEVLRATNIAKRLLEQGEYARAEKLLLKAQRMDPGGLSIVYLLEKVKEAKEIAKKSPSGSASNEKPKKSTPPEKFERSYTAEQLKGVQRVNRAGDLYAVLNLSRTANESEIKKAYRKMALKFHPDKNGAPGADDAFKKINKAFSVLSSADTRRDYDRFGEKGIDGSAGGRRTHFHSHDEFDPEEIFRQFFGSNAFGGANARVYTFGGSPFGRRQQQRRGEGGDGLPSILQLLPIFMIFLLSFLSLPDNNAQFFGLNRTPLYSSRRTTRHNSGVCEGLEYFTRPNFLREIKRERVSLFSVEQTVQAQHLRKSEESCKRDKRRKNQRLSQLYKRSGNSAEVRQLKQSKIDSCEALQRLQHCT